MIYISSGIAFILLLVLCFILGFWCYRRSQHKEFKRLFTVVFNTWMKRLLHEKQDSKRRDSEHVGILQLEVQVVAKRGRRMVRHSLLAPSQSLLLWLLGFHTASQLTKRAGLGIYWSKLVRRPGSLSCNLFWESLLLGILMGEEMCGGTLQCTITTSPR